ncbi:MAG TPA: type IV secretory system conjugative DNA transfer family protein [Acidimicrobiales bacterium]|nr:type IV secretory system conjugative DNA transfer family protein [Acidimicrobiales bacterium]
MTGRRPTAPGRQPPAGRAGAVGGPGVGLATAGVVGALALAAWCGAATAAAVGGPGCRVPPLGTALEVAVTALSRTAAPVAAGPGCSPNRAVFWTSAAVVLVGAGGVGLLVRGLTAARTGSRPRHRRRAGRRPLRLHRPDRPGSPGTGSRWASRADLAPLVVKGPETGRLVIGRAGRRLLAAEPRQSVLVVGPTQTMKTVGFAVPALLEWRGPALVTSVKTDLLHATRAARASMGRTWIYDPAAVTGLVRDAWSPLGAATTWSGARRAAAALVNAARSGTVGPADADFWYATAAKLLAPLLFAAAVSGGTMADVVRWVDTQETAEVIDVLAAAGVEEALLAAEASFGREERARSSIFTTAETVLDPFADPETAPPVGAEEIDPAPLLDGGRHTLYLCAPAHEQRRLRPLFSTLVEQVVTAVYDRCSATAAPLDPPLLVVLDEAAAVAPLEDLDALAATGAGQGIQLVTVWQDLAQVTARYGTRAASVVNNHRAKVLLSGVSDPATLEQLSGLVGESGTATESVTVDEHGGRSTTESTAFRRLAPTDALRRIPPGHGLLVYGHLPPARIRLRPWFDEPALRGLGARPPGAP